MNDTLSGFVKAYWNNKAKDDEIIRGLDRISE